MRYTELDFEPVDWPLVRQALSLALLRKRQVAIRGGALFLAATPVYGPLFQDLSRAIQAINAGGIRREGDALIYEPNRILPGRYTIESGPLSSTIEILLLLMPALFHSDFRSVLELRGVTHSVLSYPTAFIKETLLALLERMGFYAGITLRRFGFHGSGGGEAESRIYPREAARSYPTSPLNPTSTSSVQRPEGDSGTQKPPLGGMGGVYKQPPGSTAIAGAKIFFSRVDREMAMREKRTIADCLGLDEDRITVIEVLDADGYGNSIQVSVERDGITHVLFREMNFFSGDGSVQFGEEDFHGEIIGLAGEVRRAIREGALPPHIIREIYPYCVLHGIGPVPHGDGPGTAGIRYLCGKLL